MIFSEKKRKISTARGRQGRRKRFNYVNSFTKGDATNFLLLVSPSRSSLRRNFNNAFSERKSRRSPLSFFQPRSPQLARRGRTTKRDTPNAPRKERTGLFFIYFQGVTNKIFDTVSTLATNKRKFNSFTNLIKEVIALLSVNIFVGTVIKFYYTFNGKV